MSQKISGNYGILVSELNASIMVDLFSIESESMILPNEIDTKPIEWDSTAEKTRRIIEQRKTLPTTIEINGNLHPGTWGSPDFKTTDRPVADKAAMLLDMRDFPHTYRYYSTIFYGKPHRSLVIRELNLRNDPTSGSVVPYTLVLQEVFNTRVVRIATGVGGPVVAIPAEDVQQRGGQRLQPTEQPDTTVAQTVTSTTGGEPAVVKGQVSMATGSLPWQSLKIKIENRNYEIEVRWDAVDDRGVFSLRDANESNPRKKPIIDETPMILGGDLLSDVQTDKRVNGLHIVPIAKDRFTSRLSPDNIGRSVQLLVFIEKTISELITLRARGARVIGLG